jgi:SAM-dependent methyltransferase
MEQRRERSYGRAMTYVLERNEAEYERLRRQALMWERLLDRVGLGPGARCLDAGCGPGETMRLMAERGGRVTGIDVDPDVGAYAIERLHAAGHRQTTFQAADVHDVEGIFDLEQAGIGAVDGVDMTGRLKPLSADGEMYDAIYRSMLPAAISLGERRAVWPLMVGTWKEK